MCHAVIRCCHSHHESPKPHHYETLIQYQMSVSAPVGGAPTGLSKSPPSANDAATALAAAANSLSKAAQAMAEAALAMCEASDFFDALNIPAQAAELIESVLGAGEKSVDGSLGGESDDAPEEVDFEGVVNDISADDDVIGKYTYFSHGLVCVTDISQTSVMTTIMMSPSLHRLLFLRILRNQLILPLGLADLRAFRNSARSYPRLRSKSRMTLVGMLQLTCVRFVASRPCHQTCKMKRECSQTKYMVFSMLIGHFAGVPLLPPKLTRTGIISNP
jgi:hypothetical protein